MSDFAVISNIDSGFPSEKETIKNFLLNILYIWETINKTKTTIKTAIKKYRSHLKWTEAAIPLVIHAKYTVNSSGDLTGFLNLTIDNAPTIPNDNAISPDITLVTKSYYW